MLEPVMAILIIAAPWLFGFSDVSDAKAICIVVGIVMLLAGAMTQWRLFLVKLIPLRMHFGTDLLIAAVLILTPFIFGFSDEGGATRFMIIAGALRSDDRTEHALGSGRSRYRQPYPRRSRGPSLDPIVAGPCDRGRARRSHRGRRPMTQ